MGSLVVRASDSRPGSTPNATKHSPSQWVRKSCGRSQQKPRVQGAGEYFPPLQHAKIMELEIGGVAIA
ncbi:hypothetical protein TNCV_380901 [Trichonephila clavipes]|uniref:Uncharacterized protein n=1 Tax=Trichonephila clavipes TaxID=2585209 RepID=A0A8X6VJI9_TRICX|nr:hypothetical protein TNCV_380901 [Trichonephila clavipes]